MTRTEYLLTKLAEECCEVAQRATKAQCFGISEIQPTQGYTNAERIMDELVDVRVIVLMLQEDGILPQADCSEETLARKRAKVERFMEYSRQCGTLQ